MLSLFLLTFRFLLFQVHSSQSSVSSDGQRNSNPIQTSLHSKGVAPKIIPRFSDIGDDAGLKKHMHLKREVLHSNVHPKNKAPPKNKSHPPITPASDTNQTTKPIIAPLNGTIHWLKKEDLERCVDVCRMCFKIFMIINSKCYFLLKMKRYLYTSYHYISMI